MTEPCMADVLLEIAQKYANKVAKYEIIIDDLENKTKIPEADLAALTSTAYSLAAGVFSLAGGILKTILCPDPSPDSSYEVYARPYDLYDFADAVNDISNYPGDRKRGRGEFAWMEIFRPHLLSSLRIIHISDPHFTNSSRTLDVGYIIDSQNTRLRSNVLSNYLIKNKAQFRASKIVITGDLTDSGDEDDYVIAKAFVDKLNKNGFEVYSIPGNHDYCIEGNLSAEATRFARKDQATNKERRNRFIQYITGYSDYPHIFDFDYGRLILLDSMQGELDENDIFVPMDDHWAQGKFGTKQWSKLEQYITEYQTERQKGKRLIVALHHSPLHTISNDGTGGLNQAEAFMKLVSNRIDCLLFGHTTSTGVLQQGFPKEESDYGIPIINCENLEHIAWHGEMRFGGDYAKQICVARNQDGRLEIFYVGTNLGIYHNWQTSPNGGWSGEERLGGLEDTALQICVGQNQDGRLEVFYVGTNLGIYHRWQTSPNGSWSDEKRLGGFLDAAQQICVGQNQDGRLEVFYVGTNLGIYHRWQTSPNGSWSDEKRLGGFLDTAQQICVGQNQDGRLEVFYVGTNFGIYHNWQTSPNGGWSGEERLGRLEDTAQQICVGQNQDGRLEVFYVGTNFGIYHNWQTSPNGGWSGEERLGRLEDTAQQICVGQNQDGRLEIFYIGTNSTIYHNFQTAPNGGWAGEEQLASLIDQAQQICVGQNQDGRLEIFYVGTNFGIYHNWQTLPDAAYPITVVDLGFNKSEVYLTDSPFPQ